MILRQSVTYFAANAVSVVVGLLTVVVFTRLLTPAEYGVYVLSLGFAGVVNGVLFTWLRMSILRFQAEGDQRDMRRTVMVAYALTASTLPLAFLAMIAVSGTAPRTAGVLIAYVLTISLFEAGQELLRARLLASRYAVASIVRSVLTFALGLAAVLATGAGLALVAAAAVAYAITALLVARSTWGGSKAPFDRAILRDMVAFGAPLTLLGVTTSLHMGLDRFVLTWLFDTEFAGRFAAPNDLARQCIAVPCAGVFAAILPLAVRGAANETPEEAQRQLSVSAELIAAVVLPSAIGLALVSGHMSQVVFGPEFRSTAAIVLPIVAFAWGAHLIWQQYVHVSFHLAKKPHLVIIHTALTLAFGFVMLVAGSLLAGYRGAALAMLGTELVGLILGLYMTRYGSKLPVPWARLERVALAGLTMAVVTIAVERLIPGQGTFELLVLVATGGASYALACLYFDVGEVRAKLRGRALPLPSWLKLPRHSKAS